MAATGAWVAEVVVAFLWMGRDQEGRLGHRGRGKKRSIRKRHDYSDIAILEFDPPLPAPLSYWHSRAIFGP